MLSFLDLTLEYAGLAGRFDVTVAGDEVAEGKPAPDGYLAAAAGLGMDPGECLAVEDSGPGALPDCTAARSSSARPPTTTSPAAPSSMTAICSRLAAS